MSDSYDANRQINVNSGADSFYYNEWKLRKVEKFLSAKGGTLVSFEHVTMNKEAENRLTNFINEIQELVDMDVFVLRADSRHGRRYFLNHDSDRAAFFIQTKKVHEDSAESNSFESIILEGRIYDEKLLQKFMELDEYLAVNSQSKGVRTSWAYTDSSNDVEYTTLPVNHNHKFYPEMYPYFDPIKTIDDFAKSESNVMILLGDPGTGKTSFIKEMIRRNGWSSIVAYDEGVMDKDEIYINFMSGVHNALIFEDADVILSNRHDHGNHKMGKILNVADGIASSMNKKFVFTANIKNMADIDEAVTRPGRCFDIIHFRPLTREEAKDVQEKTGLVFDTEKSEYTVSEIFNNRHTDSKGRKVGFV